MKRYIHVVILLFVTLILVQGCKRTDPNETPKESAGAPGEVKDDAGNEMALLEAGRFTMGDEKEIDVLCPLCATEHKGKVEKEE